MYGCVRVDILDAIKETLQEMQVQTADLVKVCIYFHAHRQAASQTGILALAGEAFI